MTTSTKSIKTIIALAALSAAAIVSANPASNNLVNDIANSATQVMLNSVHPVLAPAAEIHVCARDFLASGDKTFEWVEPGALQALQTKTVKGTCWKRVGDAEHVGYTYGDVRILKTKRNTDADGVTADYDVFVKDTFFGTATRVIDTKQPMPYGIGTVSKSGVIDADTKGSVVILADGSEVTVEDDVRKVGTKVQVYVDFGNAYRTYSIKRGA